MLNKYVLTIKCEKNDIRDLDTALKNMNYNKVMHKPEFGHLYFFGMRKNWFPLIILEKYTARHGQKSMEERLDSGILFMAFLQDPSFRSFYVDNYDIIHSCNIIRIYYRAKDYQASAISKIMGLFNLKTKFRIDTVK